MVFFKLFIRKLGLATLAAGTLVALSPAAMGNELTRGDLPDFHSDFQAENAFQSIEEFVPEGETVEDWTQMVTVQKFNIPNRAMPAEVLLNRLAAGMKAACPGTVAAPIETTTLQGRSVSELRLDCPSNPQTGKPETMFARAIADDAHLHVVQVAYRSTPTESEKRWAQEYLDTVSLQDAG